MILHTLFHHEPNNVSQELAFKPRWDTAMVNRQTKDDNERRQHATKVLKSEWTQTDRLKSWVLAKLICPALIGGGVESEVRAEVALTGDPPSC